MNDRGSASLFMPVFVVLGFVMIAFVIALATVFGIRARAQAAADAGALAAGPVTFRPFGAEGTASEEARRFAEFNGARLVGCDCDHDPSYASRVVTVAVEIVVPLPFVGSVTVPATARAEFAPAELLRP